MTSWTKGVGRVCKSRHGWTLLVFLMCQMVFAIMTLTESLPDLALAGGVDQALTAFLLVSVHALVTANTSAFLVYLIFHVSPLFSLTPLDEAARKRMDWSNKAVIGFVVVSLLVSGPLACFAIVVWFDLMPTVSWESVLGLNEGLCAFLYALFLLADICCLGMCTRCLGVKGLPKKQRTALLDVAASLKLYILGVDGPGLLGILLVLGVSTWIHPLVSGFYWQGFVTGAICLHIVFSQASLALLQTYTRSL